MSLRRQSMAAIVLAVALVTTPAVSAAAPGGQPGRPELPPAAYNAEVPRSPQASTRSPASSAPEQPDGGSTSAGRQPARVPAALGASSYVDECEGDTGQAYDVRRLGFAMHTDATTVQLTMRPCDPATLDAFNGHKLAWTTVTTMKDRPSDDPQARTIEVTGTAPNALDVEIWRLERDPKTGKYVKTGKLPGGAAWLGESSADVRTLAVNLPSEHLGLPDVCSPRESTACLQVSFESFAPGGTTPQDTLPDAGVDEPMWPSRCRPDIEPAATEHVRLTTSSTGAAREVEAALHGAGYRADAYADAPYVEIPVGASPAVVDVLETWDDVVDVTPVATRRMSEVPDGDEQYSKQWYLPHIGLESAWEVTQGSPKVGIAIVDNGVAATRPDLKGRVGVGWDALAETTIPSGAHSDLGGHGTAVAGLAAASEGNGGVVGVDWNATIHPVRVFDHEGCFVSEPKYLRALDWIADQAAKGLIDVANFSLGGGRIPGEADRIARIVDRRAAVVAAMGNQGDVSGALPSFPAALPEVIAVGATGPDGRLATYSNQGRHLDVVAPGGDQSGSPAGEILVLADPTVEGDDYTLLNGTSFSSPLVAGVAALYRARYPGSSPADITRALVTTATDHGQDLAGYDISFGFGQVDAAEALAHRPGETLVRLAGGDRYETAARISQRAFRDPSLVDVVLLATGQDYPDALAGGPLAAREHAPLLLTPRDGLHGATRDEIVRLDPDRVLLLGGTAVLSPNVQAQLESLGIAVDRAAGGDRFETAKAIALGSSTSSWRAWNTSDVVFLATGENFPDALPGGAAAAAADAPLLLTNRTRLPDATREALLLLGPSRVIVLGGPNAVADTVVKQLQSFGIRVDRAEGGDRYATAIEALCPARDLCQSDTRFALVATGESFADALGGSAAAAALRAPLVLVPSSGSVPPIVREAMDALAPEQMVILGGEIPIPRSVEDQVRTLAVE